MFQRLQATAANLDRLTDQVWTLSGDAATRPAFGDVSLARLGMPFPPSSSTPPLMGPPPAAESRAMVAAYARELVARQALATRALQAGARDGQLRMLAGWIHTPHVAARGPLFAEQLAGVLADAA